jgi:signal transduction histidine kinase
MTLNITQRITITVAIISGIVFAVIGVVFFLSLEWGIKAKGDEKAGSTVLAAGNAILSRLNEDIMVDFTGVRIPFSKMKIQCDHWAVVRKNGKIEGAGGILLKNPFIARGALDQEIPIPDMKDIRLATVPLVSAKNIEWNDISPAARNIILANVSGGIFLNVIVEVKGRKNVLDVKWLYPDHILEIVVAENGKMVQTEPEYLPDRLPGEMEIETSLGQTVLEPKIVSWQAYNGKLIAILEGRLQSEKLIQVAVDRLGQQYKLTQEGIVEKVYEDSRLWVVTAYDLGQDIAENRSSIQSIVLGGSLMWLLVIMVAWLVTRHAFGRVDDIIDQVETINPSQLDTRLPVGNAKDELSRISQTVNKMLDRIEGGYHREQQFTGDASHEMRNPLAKIIAEIDLVLSKTRENQEYKQALDRLREYAEGMQILIESLLTLARLDGRQQNLESKPFDVADLAVDILKTLGQDSTQRIRFELGESTNPMQAVGHRQLIGIVLKNLIDNALRYSPPQSPVYLRINRNTRNIHIEIEDEGPGIPAEQASLVFNRFHRLDKSRSKETGGAGLGLSIVKAIANIHNTSVTLTQAAKQGTLATFTLPSSNHQTNPPEHNS